MTLSEKRCLFTSTLARFITVLVEEGYRVSFGEVLRTKEQQEIYVKTGKSKTMNSKHLEGLAADLNLYFQGRLIDGSLEGDAAHLRFAGERWEKFCLAAGLHPEWGGRFGVPPFEYETKIGWDANHYGVTA